MHHSTASRIPIKRNKLSNKEYQLSTYREVIKHKPLSINTDQCLHRLIINSQFTVQEVFFLT
jgi:hypothetical protein